MSISLPLAAGGAGAILSAFGVAASRVLLTAAASPSEFPLDSSRAWTEDARAQDFMRTVSRLVTCAGVGAVLLVTSLVWHAAPST